MTPYYSEEPVYSKIDLVMENEDGTWAVFYQVPYFGIVALSLRRRYVKNYFLRQTLLSFSLVVRGTSITEGV